MICFCLFGDLEFNESSHKSCMPRPFKLAFESEAFMQPLIDAETDPLKLYANLEKKQKDYWLVAESAED